jgi:hypothetical protein
VANHIDHSSNLWSTHHLMRCKSSVSNPRIE